MEEQLPNQPNLNQFETLSKHPQIKPLLQINPKEKTIEEKNLQKFLQSHSKISKTINSQEKIPSSTQYIKHFLKISQSQPHLLNLYHSLHPFRTFDYMYFSSKIKNLHALSSLDLSFTSRKQLKFPVKNLTSLKQLTDFQIRFTFYDLRDPIYLHSLFKRILPLKNLTSFSFSMVACAYFEAIHFNIFSSYLCKFTQLRALKLYFARSFQDYNQCFNALTRALSSLKSLAQIDLHFGGIGTLQAENLLKLFMTLGSIKTLTDISFGLEDCEVINENNTSEPLSESLLCLNLPSIKKLSLRFYTENENLVSISEALKEFTSLKILALNLSDSQQVTNKDMLALSSALCELPSLNSLIITISSHAQTRITVQCIASALKFLQNLVHLKLVCSGLWTIDHNQIQQFSSSLITLKSSLKFLDLDFSWQLSVLDSTIHILSEAVKELTFLKHLSIHFSYISNITSKGIEGISFAIQDLPNLSHLALSFENCQEINELNSLAQVLRHIRCLYSVNLNFGKCENLKYEDLFDALREVENIGEINLSIPWSQEIEQEVNKLKRKKSAVISWSEDYTKKLAR